ncbi:hypothetical protein F4009_07795, partial [Candidatus Poribacteria bacterium]|nr:hypothetical protein [Candidatus Poribacteria bacterium]MYH81080.1 hypothetical protein [Candidatus Poribacteria bacterium]MYK93889.1 hypothetical protein [Candidatus Poribacteria bacterium]
MSISDQTLRGFAANYPQENTVCLPAGAVARFEKGGISDVAVSPDKNLIAIASRLGVWLYDAHTKDFVSLMAVEGTGLLSKVVFSPDGTRIVTGDWDGKTTLWDINTAAALATYIHKGYINSITFSPNGKFIATGSRDATATLWDVETGTACFNITHQDSVTSTAFSPDGTLLAASSRDSTATLWHIDTEEIRWTLTHESREITFDIGHVETFNTGGIGDIAFSPDGKYFATAGQRTDLCTTLWDVETGEPLWHVTHEKQIDAVAFSPDGTSMATYYEDDAVSVLRVADGILIPPAIHAEKWIKIKRNLSIDHDKDGWGRRVQFSPDGKHLAEFKTGSNSLTLWDINTGKKIKAFDGVSGSALTLASSAEGHCFGLSRTPDPEYDTVELWDEEKRASFTHSGFVITVAMSPNGTFLATGGIDKKVKLWHVETQQCFQTLSGHIGGIVSLAFSPDETLLASGGGDNWEQQTHADGTTLSYSAGDSPVDKTAKVWKVATGKNIATLENPCMVRGIAFSPDGKHLATGTSKTVTIGVNLGVFSSLFEFAKG